MVEFVTGDILKTKAEVIAHGVAPNDNFAQGLALSLREQWPSLYKDFRHYSHGNHPKEGELWTWKGSVGPTIVNLFTQEHAPFKDGNPGKASESYVNACLKNLTKEIKKLNVKSVAITRLATGVGGLSWETVRPLIMKHLGDCGVKVFVYETYKKDLEAQEKV